MLTSSNRQDGERKILLKYESNKDGIAAWIEFLKDYDNNGSEEVRTRKLENLVSIKYNPKLFGRFLKYIDTLQANLNELASLLPNQYHEDRKEELYTRTSRTSSYWHTWYRHAKIGNYHTKKLLLT